ncbi:hypothetical protein [Sulfurimonas sp. CS5]|uniref:hypothetical protein n=1 Tax=Sulfurimonas sp. CS5 TaxID=3391145 RepID=UPI0039E7B698
MSDYKNIEEFLLHVNKYSSNNSYFSENFSFDKLNIQNEISLNFTSNLIRPKCSFAYTKESTKNQYVLGNGNYFKVENCIFQDNVTISIVNPNANIEFVNCTFKKKLVVKSTSSEDTNNIFSFILKGGEVDNLVIDGVIANYKFYINPQNKTYKKSITIQNLQINDSKFIENFKLHNTIINNIEIEDVDFEKNADFFKSIFKKGLLEENDDEQTTLGDIGFKAINFRKLTLFGDTRFNKKLIFKYVTFEGHNHFKSSILEEGLDLEYTNIQQEINFYGIHIIDTSRTSQETFRIIKHQFEKLGNKIEANKYHALELDKKRENLKSEIDNEEKRINKSLFNIWLEYIVFQVHWLSSEHSTNWFLPLLWIPIVGITSSILAKPADLTVTIQIMMLVLFLPILVSLILSLKLEKNMYVLMTILFGLSIFIFINSDIYIRDAIHYMSLIHLTTSEVIILGTIDDKLTIRQVFVLFLNKVSLGYLYYQFLMSVRKDTRK